MTMIKAMKSAEYDFSISENHEFDLGVSHFIEEHKYAQSTEEGLSAFNYYACNFWHVDKGVKTSAILDPYKIIQTKQGVKIALIGIMAPETIAKTAPGFFQDKEGNYIYTSNRSNKNNKYWHI